MLSAIKEIAWFVLFWIWDLALETTYAIFRCRPKKDIVNENILITGTGQGLGRLIAERLARAGNTLHCVDINQALNEEAAAAMRNPTCTVYTYTCDIGEPGNVTELGEQIRMNVPDRHLSYLFNIAGIVMGKSFAEETEEQMLKVMKVNLLGTMYLQKLVYGEMVENYGHVINVSSLAGLVPGSLMGSYAASKFAVRGLTLALQVEMELLNVTNVKFTCILPHVTKTGLFNNVEAKWAFAFPLLEPGWVADQIIIATREERDQVFLPKMCLPFMSPQHLMSTRVWRAYSSLMGSDLMRTFVKIRPE